MAGAIRLVSIERGHDPARFVAMPFGGGGALHAGALIREIGLRSVLVPRFPGITSALGCVLADLRHDMVQTLNVMLDGLDGASLERRMQAAGEEASAVIAAAGIPVERTDVVYELDMHYVGQTHTVAVPLPVSTQGIDESMIRTAFEAAYLASFSRILPGLPIRIVSLRDRRDRPATGIRFLGVRAERGRHRSTRLGAVRGGFGSTAVGATPAFGRDSICRQTRASTARRSSNSPMPPS